MPTVPSSFAPQISETTYNPPAMGAPDVSPAKNFAPEQIKEMGQQTQNLGTVAQNLGMHLEAEIANAQVKEADNHLTDSVINTVQPYLQLQGKDAITAYDGTKDAISKTAQDISDGLTNPLQKQMFRQVALRRLQSAHLQMQEHQLKQVHQYELTETEKRAEVNSNAAIAQWGTWQMSDSPFAIAKAVALNSVDEALQKRGIPLDSATAQETRLGASTTIHMNVIGQMLTAQNPGMAKQYFDRYQAEIDPRRWDDIGRSMKSQSALSEGVQMAMAMAPEILNNTTDIETLRARLYEQSGGGTPSFKADTFNNASAQLETMYQRHKQANQENRDKLAIPVYQKILDAEAGGGKLSPAALGSMPEFQTMKLSTDPETVKTAVQISDHVWSEHHAVLVENRAEARANKVSDAQEKAIIRQEQRDQFDEYQLHPETLAQMSDADVLQTATKLGPFGTKLVELRRKVASPEALAKVSIPAEMTNAAIKQLDIGKAHRPEFIDSINSFLASQQTDQKHVFNQVQMRQAIAYATAKVAVKDDSWTRIFGATSTKYRYQVADPSAIVIPEEANNKITLLLKQQNISDTPANRVRIYDAINAEAKANGGR